jgi:hypothetical protein
MYRLEASCSIYLARAMTLFFTGRFDLNQALLIEII